ncbi:hypothetical protein E8E15_003875 [Penicillium rubens]|nr:hypothetical protein E8E15_003875 [Penicillium rubens]
MLEIVAGYLSRTDIADPYHNSDRLAIVDISPSGAGSKTRKMPPETPSQANVPVSKASLAGAYS